MEEHVHRRHHVHPDVAIIFILIMVSSHSWKATDRGIPPAKNVILMIPDGCSGSIQTLTRRMKGTDLALDGMLVGAVKTHPANSVITGSAVEIIAQKL